MFILLSIYHACDRAIIMCMIEELPALHRPAACTICPARPVWHRVQTGASCPAPGRVSCLAWSALVLAPPWFWHGLPCCLSCAVRLGALGLGSPPAGYIGSAGGGAGHARDKIFQRKRRFFGVRVANTHPSFTKRNPSDCAILQKFQKIQKDPFRSLECAIIN